MRLQFLLMVLSGKIFAMAIALKYFRRYSLAYKLVFWQVLLATAAEIFGHVSSFYSKSNLWFFNFYWIAEFLLVSAIALSLVASRPVRRYIVIAGVITTGIYIANLISQGLQLHPTLGISAINITAVSFYFAVLFQAAFTNKHLVKEPDFWLSIAMILFYGCLLPYYALFNYLYAKHPDVMSQFFKIIVVLDVIRYPITGISLYLAGSQGVKKQAFNQL